MQDKKLFELPAKRIKILIQTETEFFYWYKQAFWPIRPLNF
jgi:hypothetical protein